MKTFVLFLVCATAAAAEGPLRAERDVPRPERVSGRPAEYPGRLHGTMPMVMGLIFLDVELDEEGRPVDIKILSGVPLLDGAAVEAVKNWRYRPTVVDGRPRRVAVIEVVDLFPSEGYRARHFIKMLNDPKSTRPYRLLAIERLGEVGLKRKDVVKALETAASDPDEEVQKAASALLRDQTGNQRPSPRR